jgi:putative hydrolases of HD superfamily
MTRIERQLSFVIEIDKLKTILRQTLLCDQSRRENSAEHSWHLAVMAMLLGEYAAGPVDVTRVMKMLLIHDVVEVDAGDTFAYDTQALIDKDVRERAAADRLFGLLPEDQGRELRALWDEFEERETTVSKFANALDRLQPLLHNAQTEGGTWRIHKVRREQVLARMDAVRIGMPEVWPMVTKIVDDACECGWVTSDL